MRAVCRAVVVLGAAGLIFQTTEAHPSLTVTMLLLAAVALAGFAGFCYALQDLERAERGLDRRRRAREAVRDWRGYVADWHEQADAEDRRRRRQPPQER